MTKRQAHFTRPPRERAFLVGVEVFGSRPPLALKDSLAELALLCETADLEVVGELTQKVDRPNVETYIGPGKVEELRALAEAAAADMVVFDDELSPRHQRELELHLGQAVRVLDRTALVLDIFAQHAHTSEGMLQVELAQYQYYLPRLTGAWTHLERQTGGGGGRAGGVGGVGLRGPGETQLEVDRRKIRQKISHLKLDLEKVRAHRIRYRSQRRQSRTPVVSLVGYTNSGKSTLLNTISGSKLDVADKLFATLDPTTRRVELPGNTAALFTDTVGFIQKLPSTLVAAFHATLEEIAEADLLVHVVDISHPNALNQAAVVNSTLAKIGAGRIPVLTALNKVDRLANPARAAEVLGQYRNSVLISARGGTGVPDLLQLVRNELFESYQPVTVRLPYSQGGLIALFHDLGQVERIEHTRGGVSMQGRLPGRLLAQFAPWLGGQAAPGVAAAETATRNENHPL
jgi:GTP-binding protein HflX